ncbi:hypothetical protein ACLBKU_01590 [Erythrobacter sp. NE805]|uniref:hypothetical protein n=1 Tax=Erythrobacter sp. NE805 TaxID=3389875 RepID=UPI00396B0325
MPSNRSRALGALAALLLVPGGAAWAQDGPDQGGAAKAVFACRAIASEAERLACYDREVGALEEAEKAERVVIVEQAEIREARRGLFGFTLPKIGLFGKRDGTEAEEIDRVEEPLASFGFDASGRATFTLANGAKWLQIDNQAVLGTPKPGDVVRIESAALGSYRASIGGRRAIRVRRVG